MMEEVEAQVEERSKRVFEALKPYCIELLDLLHNPKKHPPAIPAFLDLLRSSPPHLLRPFFDYVLFPLLLLLDAAVQCRSQQNNVNILEEEQTISDIPVQPHTVGDFVAEGVLQCMEQLLLKCSLGSVDQMVVILKKLTQAAMLSPSEATEEIREGVIKCFRALLVTLLPCPDDSCLCKQIIGWPSLMDARHVETIPKSPEYDSGSQECLLAFLQSPLASAAVGHWLSLLLKAADTEAARGHRGSRTLRIEAFFTLRILVAKVGTADALAFFLPGVVSQFTKVLHVTKTMLSGAAGNVEAIDQAIRGMAEYLMVVLEDDANAYAYDTIDSDADINLKNYRSTYAYLEELRHLPKNKGQQKDMVNDLDGENQKKASPQRELQEQRKDDSNEKIGSLQVKRTKEWIKETSANVNKLLAATFPHMCIHQAKRVRQGLLAAVGGILSKCRCTLKESRLMLLECLCVLVVDESEEVSSSAQEFLEFFFTCSGKDIQSDIIEIVDRKIEKLPKLVLESEEAFALSHAQQLLVILYYSGPGFVVDRLLQSPVTAARFLDVFALCLSHNSAFVGSLEKFLLPRPSTGYIQSVAELKAQSHLAGYRPIPLVTSCNDTPEVECTQEGEKMCLLEDVQKSCVLPRMPPWFAYIGSQRLYQTLADILRLIGLSSAADCRSEVHLSVIADIPLGHIRKLVSEVRATDYSGEGWQSWYSRTGSGKLLRQASTAVCILNEMLYGFSKQVVEKFSKLFHKSAARGDILRKLDFKNSVVESHDIVCAATTFSMWGLPEGRGIKSHLIDCVGRILHEYLSPEIWDFPIERSVMAPNAEAEDISLHFFSDAAMLHQVILEGIGVFALCLGQEFASSGFLHSSLYLLLENLVSPNFNIQSASDAVLHIFAITSGYSTVGQLVLANADYIIDSICQQLRHLDLNRHVPGVLAAMLSYIGVAEKIIPLLDEPMRSVAIELEVLGRHQHPDLTVPFLKAVAEIAKSLKCEASKLPGEAESALKYVKMKTSEMREKSGKQPGQKFRMHANANGVRKEFPDFESDATNHFVEHNVQIDQWEEIVFKLNASRRYRRTLGSLAGSCLTAATPLLASSEQTACLVALEIIEDGIKTLSSVEAAYRHERETKEAVEEVILDCSFFQLQDSLDAADEGTDENRMLPAMNKIWPFLVICLQSSNPVVVRRCLVVLTSSVQTCGGDFFSRRFHADGPKFWRLLTTSPFYRKADAKEKIRLMLPYRTLSSSSDESLAEVSSLKVQISMLNMIADLSRNKRSASALQIVLKKVCGLVVGIACSGVSGLRDASLNALSGLACIDADLIWLLLADVYFSMKKDMPLPPLPELPEISQLLPAPSSPKEYLHVQYGGKSYGFDINFSSVEFIFNKIQSLCALTKQLT